ncbi:MAG TPA: YafY family protein [Acetobacteraceae bacterium]|jgi:predicted DNA-binding transcriptional regulator YafY|nr:YafY family protein [Acetobacteraceae bacterium]
MRRTDRLFDVIQALRTASGPLTAARLAERLEVTPRTIYRDIAVLQARQVPIEGAAGIGYVLRRGFDLPPLMFTIEEVEAIAVGARMLCRTGDQGLLAAAESVLSKITVALPDQLRDYLAMPPFFVADNGAPAPAFADLSVIREAIRDERKLRISYRDEQGTETERTIWPIAVAYCTAATLISAWCELRDDFRHFRVDRIRSLDPADAPFPVSGRSLFTRWIENIRLEHVERSERDRVPAAVRGAQ